VTLPDDDPDAIVYEVWHVRVSPISPVAHPFDNYLRQRGTTLDSENTIGGCNCSFFSTSRLALTSTTRRIYGSLPFCEFFFSFPGWFFVPISQCVDENRYEKRKRRTTPVVETYHFVGYSSLYPFYCFPDKVRLRLRSVSLYSFLL
jgi:hypothetical protein